MKREKNPIKWTERGKFRLQTTKENLSGFDSDTRKLIMTKILEFHFFILLLTAVIRCSMRLGGKNGEEKRKINKKTIIFNRNLCFFPALLSLATFMLSINFHFLLFGHSLDCRTSFKSPLGWGGGDEVFLTLRINLKQ